MKTVVVIGGGIAGLAAAHRLIERRRDNPRGFDVMLLEATARLGGVIQTEHRDGFVLERGPDSFISEKPEATELVKRLGLTPHLIKTNQAHRRSFIVRNGKLCPVPEGFQLLAPSRLWPFVTSDIFSWRGKARMAMDLLLPRGNSNGHADESLAQFVRRRLGDEALERMAQPMIGGIYTADPEQLSLSATMPRFLEMERKDRSVILAMWKRARQQNKVETGSTSGARYSLFLSLDDGMQMLVERLAARLPATTIQLNSPVESLSYGQSSAQWRVQVNRGASINADAICLAIPPYGAAQLLRESDMKLAEELQGIEYASTATVNLAYEVADTPHALEGFGFVVPFLEKRTIIACTFSSVKFNGRAPEGRVLLRAFVGGALQPEMFALDETEMINRVRTDLRELLGIKNPPLFAELTRWPNSMPQYHIGHLERVKRIKERLSSLPGLTLAGNAYAGPGIPDCIRSGETAADQLIKSLPKY
ncbi:MAG: protoporphyrinogen oxidase [Pyrinomonadaceae bacterium]